MKLSMSVKLLTALAVLGTMSSQAMAQDNDRDARKQARRAEQRADRAQQRVQQPGFDRNAAEAARMQAARDGYSSSSVNFRTRNYNKAQNPGFDVNAAEAARLQAIKDGLPTANTIPTYNYNQFNRWDNNHRWHSDRNIVSYNKAFRNWDAQRDYLKANIRRLNQANMLTQLQQQQLNAEMQAAYLAYHDNHYNGRYGWDYYSEPQFIDYLQLNQPSLLDRILGYLGVGSGGYLGNNNYLYSDNWNTERDQLAANMAQIHTLAVQGRITPFQEQELLSQMRSEYYAYRNNNYNGAYGWTQYSDPNFVDYLRNQRPSLLTTIRSYLR